MDTQSARLWMAMNIGPLWIGRDEEDPLSPQAIMRDESTSKRIIEKESVSQIVAQTSNISTQQNEVTHHFVSTPLSQEVPEAKLQKIEVIPQGQIFPTAPVKAEVEKTAKRLDSPGTHRKESHHLAPIGLPKDRPGEVTHKPVEANVITQATWTELRDFVSQCQACQSMCATRLTTVFGVMEPTAKMVIVGEAPGRDEDIQGKPFVGKSGELLENILHALGLERGKDVAIVNVLKCRPPRNRDPHPAEIEMCRPYLERQLSLLNPKVVILSGRIAAHALLGSEATMKQLRQNQHSLFINGELVPTIVTYHPSYLLRSPSDKLQAWRDFMAAKHVLLGL